MEPQQVARRAGRGKKQKYRKAARAKPTQSQRCRPSAAEQQAKRRRARPCCGLIGAKCTCKPPPGLQKQPLNALAKRYLATPLCTVEDTTDVSKFRSLMQKRCESVPLWVLLFYAYVHTMFNQGKLLKAMLDKKALLFRPQSVDWTKLANFIRKAEQKNKQLCRPIITASR